MKLFKKKKILEEKRQLPKPLKKPKKEDPFAKGNIIKPVVIGLGVLVLIILIALLTQNKIILILVAIVAQIGFIAYLATTLEKQYEIKLRHLREKEDAEEKAVELKKELEKAKAQVKFKSSMVQKGLAPQITNFEDLKKYINNTLKLRFKKDDIKMALISSGWPTKKIEMAFFEIEQARLRKTI